MMVRHYRRKSDRAKYTVDELKEAIEAISNGASVKATAKNTGISAKTLRRHRDQKVAQPGTLKLGSKLTVFTPEQESELVKHIQDMEKATETILHLVQIWAEKGEQRV